MVGSDKIKRNQKKYTIDLLSAYTNIWHSINLYALNEKEIKEYCSIHYRFLDGIKISGEIFEPLKNKIK